MRPSTTSTSPQPAKGPFQRFFAWRRIVPFFLLALTLGTLTGLVGLKQYLTPKRLTAWTQAAWSERFLGDLRLDEVAWHFPAKLRIRNVRIRAHATQASDDLTIGEIRAELSIASLLRRQIRLTQLDINHINLKLHTTVSQQQDPNRTWRLEDSFTPRQTAEKDEASDEKSNWRFLIDSLDINALNVDVQAPEIKAQIQEVQVKLADLHYFLGDGSLALKADLSVESADLQREQAPKSIHLKALKFTTSSVAWSKHAGAQELVLQALKLQFLGGLLHGDVHLVLPDQSFQVNADLWADLDFKKPFWQFLEALISPEVFSQVTRSPLCAHLRAKHDASQHLQIDLQPKVADTKIFGLDQAGIQLVWSPPQLDIQRAYLRQGEQQIVLNAELALNMQAQPIAIERHLINFSSEHFALPDLMRPLLSATWLPETLQHNVKIQGQRLWPRPSSRMDAQALFHNIGVRRDMHLHACSMNAKITIEDTTVVLEQAQTDIDGLQLSVAGFVDTRVDKPMDVDIRLSTSQTPVFLKPLLACEALESMRSDVHIKGTQKRPQIDGFFRLAGLRSQVNPTIPIDVQMALLLDQGRLRVRKIRLSDPKKQTLVSGFFQAQIQDKRGHFLSDPKIDGEVGLTQFNLGAWFPEYTSRGNVTANVLLSGSAQHPRAMGWLRVASPVVKAYAFENIDLAFTANPHFFDIQHVIITPAIGGTIRGRAQYDLSHNQYETTWAMRHVPLQWLTNTQATLPNADASLSVSGTPKRSLVDMHVQTPDDTDFTLHGIIQAADKQLDLTLRGYTELELLSSFLPEDLLLQGHWSTQVRVKGAWQAPSLDLFSDVPNLALNKNPLGNQRLTLQGHNVADKKYRFVLEALGVAKTTADLTLNRRITLHSKTDWEIEKITSWFPKFEVQGMDLRSRGHILASVSHDPAKSQPTDFNIELLLERLDLEAVGQNATLNAPVTLHANTNKIEVSPIQITGDAANLAYRARIDGPWTQSDPSHQKITRILSDARGGVELGFVAQWLPVLGQTNGMVEFLHYVRGTRLYPEHQARIYLPSPVQILPRGANVEINLRQGAIELDPKRIVVQDIRGQIGEGVFVLQGNIGLHHWHPTDYKLQFDAQELPFSSANLVVEANAHIEAKGTGTYPKISGTIDILRGRFLKQLRFEDFNFMGEQPVGQAPVADRLPWLKDIQLDLHATNSTGFTVKFDAGIFGVSTILNADLHVTQNALHPRVVGRVAAEQGYLQFPKAKLNLTQAALDLEPTPDDKIGGVILAQADGEVSSPVSEPGGGQQIYQVGLHAEGPLHAPVLEFTSDQGLGKLEILSLLTTGYVALTDLVSGGGSQGSQLDAALAFAGSQISGPLTRLAEKQLERALNLQLEIGAEFTQSQVRVVAAKSFNRRLRVEGSYSHAFSEEQSSVATRAQLALTDRFFFEGTAARDLTGANTSANGDSIQSNLELKLRFLGQ